MTNSFGVLSCNTLDGHIDTHSWISATTSCTPRENRIVEGLNAGQLISGIFGSPVVDQDHPARPFFCTIRVATKPMGPALQMVTLPLGVHPCVLHSVSSPLPARRSCTVPSRPVNLPAARAGRISVGGPYVLCLAAGESSHEVRVAKAARHVSAKHNVLYVVESLMWPHWGGCACLQNWYSLQTIRILATY